MNLALIGYVECQQRDSEVGVAWGSFVIIIILAHTHTHTHTHDCNWITYLQKVTSYSPKVTSDAVTYLY